MPDDGRYKSNCAYPILIIDDYPLRQAAYSALFELYGSSNAVIGHWDPDTDKEGSAPEGNPLAVVVLGGVLISSMEGRIKLEAVMRKLTSRVVAVVENHTPECVAYAIDIQLKGVLPVFEEPSVVCAALDFIAAGGCYIPHVSTVAGCQSNTSLLHADPESTDCQKRDDRSRNNVGNGLRIKSELTRRQNEVLDDLANGRSNKEIAGNLGISEATVKSHIRQVMLKLHATNRTQAALLARDLF